MSPAVTTPPEDPPPNVSYARVDGEASSRMARRCSTQASAKALVRPTAREYSERANEPRSARFQPWARGTRIIVGNVSPEWGGGRPRLASTSYPRRAPGGIPSSRKERKGPRVADG